LEHKKELSFQKKLNALIAKEIELKMEKKQAYATLVTDQEKRKILFLTELSIVTLVKVMEGFQINIVNFV